MDTIWIPRHRGRVVFRSRFPDYVGAYVHHCHILLHEDNGMMHVIEATPFVSQSNYAAKDGASDVEGGFHVPRVRMRTGGAACFWIPIRIPARTTRVSTWNRRNCSDRQIELRLEVACPKAVDEAVIVSEAVNQSRKRQP